MENIAKAIEKSGISRYQISKDTGIDQAVLCRIANKGKKRQGSCSIETADILCKYLGLELTSKKRREVKKKHK